MSLRSKFRSIRKALNHFDVIIYSETSNDWIHIGSAVEKIAKHSSAKIAYLYSDPKEDRRDLKQKYGERLSLIYVGSGFYRSFLFGQLQATTLIMTLTDLGKGALRRSPNVGNYVYIFHSITSTHMCYLSDSFDHYDTICCVGPHHAIEIRKREKLANLKEKKLVSFGHSQIENMRTHVQLNPSRPDPHKVIIAPSWGPSSLVEILPAKFYEGLLSNGFSIYLRLHSMSAHRQKYFAANIDQLAQNNKKMEVDYNHLDLDRLCEFSVMISDWSGAATEFAFGLKRPVVFIDTPRKVRNKTYKQLETLPLEVGIRSRIGKVVSVDAANNIGSWLADFINGGEDSATPEELEREYRRVVYTERPSWVSLLSELSNTHSINF